MADAIQWSLPLGNGAVNLHYNEVVYSWFSNRVNISSYDYEIMIAIHPQCISSFIFTRAGYDAYSGDITITGATPDGAMTNMLRLNYNSNHYLTQAYIQTVIFLLK